MNAFGLPNEPQFDTMNEKFDTMNEHLRKIANTRVQEDYTMAPGSKFLAGGNRDAGFFGFVQAADLITGDALALEIGLSNGVSQNSDVAWIKYIYKGKICFTPLKTHRHSVTWDAIYNTGSVYASGNEGTLPPMGRMGIELTIDAADNSINTATQHFLGDKTSGMDYADAVAIVGDTVTLKGWANGANNGTFTVDSITDTKIVLSGGVLVSESANRLGKIYKTSNAVTQNRTVVIGGLTYKVRLLRGASNDPLNSSGDSDRDGIGPDDEWNAIILPLHQRAKTQSWIHPAYVGTTDYWGVDLTDEDLRTHYNFGSGSYSWCQEVRDITTWRRVYRGHVGASFLIWAHSWNVHSTYGFRPVLELLG